MNDWYFEEYHVRQHIQDALREAEQERLANLAVAGRVSGRSYRFSVAQVVEWLQCQMSTLRWRLEQWIRAATPSTALLVAVPARQSEPCQRAAHE